MNHGGGHFFPEYRACFRCSGFYQVETRGGTFRVENMGVDDDGCMLVKNFLSSSSNSSPSRRSSTFPLLSGGFQNFPELVSPVPEDNS